MPTASDLEHFEYRGTRKGWLWDNHRLVYGVDENSLYDKAIYTAHYEAHNVRVREYFRQRPDDLLILNLSTDDAMVRLGEFLKVDSSGITMPHLNSSA